MTQDQQENGCWHRDGGWEFACHYYDLQFCLIGFISGVTPGLIKVVQNRIAAGSYRPNALPVTQPTMPDHWREALAVITMEY